MEENYKAVACRYMNIWKIHIERDDANLYNTVTDKKMHKQRMMFGKWVATTI